MGALFFSSLGWEVVQSVGHQTLDLIILVRVQASQPIRHEQTSGYLSGQFGLISGADSPWVSIGGGLSRFLCHSPAAVPKRKGM